MQQVKARLTEQINYWDARANTLKAQQDASKRRSSPISGNVRQRADELSDRLQRRMAELEREKAIVAKPPQCWAAHSLCLSDSSRPAAPRKCGGRLRRPTAGQTGNSNALRWSRDAITGVLQSNPNPR